MLNLPIILSQNVQADSCCITEITRIKRNEVEIKESFLKRPLEKDWEPCCGSAEELVEI